MEPASCILVVDMIFLTVSGLKSKQQELEGPDMHAGCREIHGCLLEHQNRIDEPLEAKGDIMLS